MITSNKVLFWGLQFYSIKHGIYFDIASSYFPLKDSLDLFLLEDVTFSYFLSPR